MQRVLYCIHIKACPVQKLHTAKLISFPAVPWNIFGSRTSPTKCLAYSGSKLFDTDGIKIYFFKLKVWWEKNNMQNTVKCVLSGHSKRRQKMVLKTNYHLMQVKSIVECSKGSILQYFRPSLSCHLSLNSLFCQFLSGPLRHVYCIIKMPTCWVYEFSAFFFLRFIAGSAGTHCLTLPLNRSTPLSLTLRSGGKAVSDIVVCFVIVDRLSSLGALLGINTLSVTKNLLCLSSRLGVKKASLSLAFLSLPGLYSGLGCGFSLLNRLVWALLRFFAARAAMLRVLVNITVRSCDVLEGASGISFGWGISTGLDLSKLSLKFELLRQARDNAACSSFRDFGLWTKNLLSSLLLSKDKQKMISPFPSWIFMLGSTHYE